jgi:hypothetical protein
MCPVAIMPFQIPGTLYQVRSSVLQSGEQVLRAFRRGHASSHGVPLGIDDGVALEILLVLPLRTMREICLPLLAVPVVRVDTDVRGLANGLVKLTGLRSGPRHVAQAAHGVRTYSAHELLGKFTRCGRAVDSTPCQRRDGLVVAMPGGCTLGPEREHDVGLLPPDEAHDFPDDLLLVGLRKSSVAMAAELEAFDAEHAAGRAQLRAPELAELLGRRNGEAGSFPGIPVGGTVQRTSNARGGIPRERGAGRVGLVVGMGEDCSQRPPRLSDGDRRAGSGRP